MKTIILSITLCIGIISCTNSSRKSVPDQIEGIIDGDASLTKVTSDMTFKTAGSPLYMDGYLYFTNNNFTGPDSSSTFRMSPTGEVDTLVRDNGVTTTLWASGKGTIYACEMLGHRVIELTKDGEFVKVVAGEYGGKRIDGPNDLIVDSKGGVYFTDSQFIAGREKMQETTAVYYVRTSGEVVRVIDNIAFPNGVVLSPDGATLYVANTPGERLFSFDVNEDGTVTNQVDFAAIQLVNPGEPGGADGLAVDMDGNVYVATTRGLGIQIFDKNGTHLGNISVPTSANNVSFGGADKKTLYISAVDGIYSIPVKTAGYVIQ